MKYYHGNGPVYLKLMNIEKAKVARKKNQKGEKIIC